MKLNKLLLALGLALGLGMASQAQAGAFYGDASGTGLKTLADWLTDGPITDADGDSRWTLNSYSVSIGGADVVLGEVQFGAVDYYSNAVSFAGGGIQNASYDINYSIQILSLDELIASVHLDSTHAGTGTSVHKVVTDHVTGALIFDGTSIDGLPVEANFAGHKWVDVAETYTAGPDGLLISSLNTFDVHGVPEPSTLALMGLGLLGLSLNMRRRDS